MAPELTPLSVAVRDRRLLGGVLDWHPRQLALLDSLDGPERRHLWELGRQSGKDCMLAAYACHNALLRPDLDAVLPPGMTRDILVCAPRRDQAEEFVRTCATYLENSPLLGAHAQIQSDRILFEPTRVDKDGRPFTARARILALPANARTTRGHRASAVIYNEQAHLDEAGGPGSAEALWRALTPSLRAFGQAGRILCSSTPAGSTGKFAELCEQAQNGWANTRYERGATWEVVPVSEEEIEEWRSELGELWFLQEYAAERIDGAGAFFDLAGVSYLDGPALPAHGSDWVAGIDPATIRDRFAMTIVGRSIEDPEVLLLGATLSLQAGGAGLLDIDRETSRFKDNLEACWRAMEPYLRYGLRIATDSAKAQAVRSFYGRKGVEPEVVSLQGRERLGAFIRAKTRIQDESLRLFPSSDLLEDLRLVQLRDSETIHLPRVRGRHCDTASALVNAVSLLTTNLYAPAAVPSIVPPLPYSNYG